MSIDIGKYDVEQIALSRHGHQYGHSPLYRDFIRATVSPIDDLQDVLFNLLDIDLATAKGIKLDLMGRIVGAPAVIADALPQPFFGFDDQEEALGFGEIDEPGAGGYFRESGQPSNIDWVLDSDTYRRVVDAQIIKNHSDCTPDEIIKTLQTTFGADFKFKYFEIPMAVIIAPEINLTMQYKQLIRSMLPMPAGVALAILDNKYDDQTLTDDDIKDIFADYY